MKTAFFAAITGLLMVTNSPVQAHPDHGMRHPLPQDYVAVGPDHPAASVVRDRTIVLEGPTNDTSSTATGGPSGGIY